MSFSYALIALLWARILHDCIVRLWFPDISPPDIYSVILDSTHKTVYYVNNEKRTFPFTEKEYILPPNIRKMHWMRLGNKLTENEHCLRDVPDHCYYSIRLDGKNFSSVIPFLAKHGIFSQGYSDEFDKMMQKLAHYLIVEFNAVHAYVQSDEITLLISPMIHRKTNQFVPHKYNGRHDKLTTIAAGIATQYLNIYISRLAGETPIPNYPIVVMDARVGIYDSHRDAFELILWRSYDCSVNAISTALYMNNMGRSLEFISTAHRLVLLKEKGILDTMSEHQKYGTLLFREKVGMAGSVTNKDTDSKNKNKYSIVQISGNIVTNIKCGKIQGI